MAHFCPFCGKPVPEGASYCVSCGATTVRSQSAHPSARIETQTLQPDGETELLESEEGTALLYGGTVPPAASAPAYGSMNTGSLHSGTVPPGASAPAYGSVNTGAPYSGAVPPAASAPAYGSMNAGQPYGGTVPPAASAPAYGSVNAGQPYGGAVPPAAPGPAYGSMNAGAPYSGAVPPATPGPASGSTDTGWRSLGSEKPKSGKLALILSLVGGLVVALVLAGGFLWPGFFRGGAASEPQSTAQQQNGTPAGEKQSETPADTAHRNPFLDITKDDPFYESCLWAYEQGILQSDTARAEESITRKEVLVYLWRAIGAPDPGDRDCPFTDVKPGDGYYKAVLWALNKKVVSHNAETFNPDKAVSRAEAVVMMFKATDGQSLEHEPVFSDTAAGTWYTDAATWASLNGILDADPNKQFHPKDSLECGRFLLWLYRRVDPTHAPAPAN